MWCADKSRWRWLCWLHVWRTREGQTADREDNEVKCPWTRQPPHSHLPESWSLSLMRPAWTFHPWNPWYPLCLLRKCPLPTFLVAKVTWSEWVKSFSRVWLFVTLWTAAYQAPPTMGFSGQEYWSGLPFPSPGDLPNPGIKPRSPALKADALPSELWVCVSVPYVLVSCDCCNKLPQSGWLRTTEIILSQF